MSPLAAATAGSALRLASGPATFVAIFVALGVALMLSFAPGLASSPAAAGETPRSTGPLVESFDLSVTINPASARWVSEALDDAEADGAYMVVFRLDTPGGLDESMRDIVKDLIAAPMPVVVYVSPDGARAASAGMFITEAADVAAMAPQTNIGSATPISLGGGKQDEVLGRKVRNDAAAYARALAEGHGRNGDLAAGMVRDAVNVTASEAKRRNLVDVVAPSQERLLRELDGFRVKGPKAQRLETTGARIESHDLPFKFQALELLVNPNVVFLLFTLGLIGLGFELFHPGAIFPGALGAVSLILALFGLAELPINVAGLLLILLAFGLFAAEAFIVSHGALAAGGIIALAAGGLLLFDTDNPAFDISVPLVILTAAALGGFFVWIVSKAVQARHRRVRTGAEEMVGARGVVRSALDPVGHVFVDGALWRAHTADEHPVEQGREVVVEEIEGLTLTVSETGDD
jgi:membrane-bound serine protease (ClpP class)